MRLKEEIDANVRVLTGDRQYTPEDQALLKEFSAKLSETETVKQMRVE